MSNGFGCEIINKFLVSRLVFDDVYRGGAVREERYQRKVKYVLKSNKTYVFYTHVFIYSYILYISFQDVEDVTTSPLL